jgi:hypothetical protein
VARGKRAGTRAKRRFRPALLLLALGITLCVVAWGYLVYAAIDFGDTARDGQTEAWWWLGVAAVGAAACLFVGLMLIARLSRALGITRGAEPKPPKELKRPRPSGGSSSHSSGRRAAR